MPTTQTQRVLIYVQHLLGVGHLQRAFRLAAALAERNYRVDLVSGGRAWQGPLPEKVTLHQLAPAHSPDGSFNRILDADGNPIDETWKSARRARLLALFEDISPQVLISETFPFGRRMMSFELIPLLERARASGACVIASIRDILQPKSKPGREQEIVERIERYYDHVIVHGDARIAGLELSFASAPAIADKIFYSGYICANSSASAAPAQEKIRHEVLVSAGGSDTGYEVLQTALRARPLCSLAANRWRVMVSPTIDPERFHSLQKFQQPEQVIVERNRNDFNCLMRQARLSISQAGYNTMTDILRAGVAAVVVPYSEADEMEQTLRARAFEARRRVVTLDRQRLEPTQLAAAIDAADNLQTSIEVDLDGASNSARQITNWLECARV